MTTAPAVRSLLPVLVALAMACGVPDPRATSPTAPTATPTLAPVLAAPTEATVAPQIIPTARPSPTPEATPSPQPAAIPPTPSGPVRPSSGREPVAPVVSPATSVPTATPVPSFPPTPAPVPPSATTPAGSLAVLGLRLASGRVAPGQQFTLEVWLDPGGRGIGGAQFALRFPEAQLEFVAVERGPLLGPAPPGDRPEIQGWQVEPGVLRYAAARVGETAAPTPPGSVASIGLRVREGVASGAGLEVGLRDVKLAEPAGVSFRSVGDVSVSAPLRLVVTAP